VKARVASIEFFFDPPTALVEEGPPLQAARPRASTAVAARTRVVCPVREIRRRPPDFDVDVSVVLNVCASMAFHALAVTAAALRGSISNNSFPDL
jgi:hypothetical protein